jgi:asparagine synthetase B (glutamine-hydrolysing)
MCGIIGYVPIEPEDCAKDVFKRLVAESRIRGLHACGIATHHSVLRSYSVNDVIKAFDPSLSTIFHTRYSLSGDWRVLENNQPLVVGGSALAFNGVIHMGTKAEFEAVYHIQCGADNDGEIFLRRSCSAEEFIQNMSGSFAGVWLDEAGKLWAGRNARRPLWKVTAYGARWYASTADIFRRAGFAGMLPVPVGVE